MFLSLLCSYVLSDRSHVDFNSALLGDIHVKENSSFPCCSHKKKFLTQFSEVALNYSFKVDYSINAILE